MRALVIEKKSMHIIIRIDPNTLGLFMDLEIHQTNARSWDNLVLSITNADLLMTADMTPQIKINLTERKIAVIFLIMQRMRSSCRRIIK